MDKARLYIHVIDKQTFGESGGGIVASQVIAAKTAVHVGIEQQEVKDNS